MPSEDKTAAERRRRQKAKRRREGWDFVQTWVPSKADGDSLRQRAAEMRQASELAVADTGTAASRQDQIRRLAEWARQEFATTCFWNVRLSADVLDDLPIIFERMRRYGGIRGWKTASTLKRLAGDEMVKWH